MRHFLRDEVESILIGLRAALGWVCSVLDPQDSINELLNCVLCGFGQENGGLMRTAALVESIPIFNS